MTKNSYNMTFPQNIIEEALKAHLRSLGLQTQDKIVEMDFTAGRKNKNGLTVDITISDDPAAAVKDNSINASTPSITTLEARPISIDFNEAALSGTVASAAEPIEVEELEDDETTENSVPWDTVEYAAANPTPSSASVFGA